MKLLVISVFCALLSSAFALESHHEKVNKKGKVTKDLHWGINLEPSAYFELAAERFKRNVELRTNNSVKVHIHIKDYTQEQRDHLVDVQSNKYQMGQEVVNLLADKEAIFTVWELPFLFEDDDHVFAFMESPYAKESLKTLSKYGVTAVGYTYSGGFMYTVGDKIDSLSELKGKDLYVEHASRGYTHLLKNELSLNKTVKDMDINNPNGSSELLSSFLEQLYKSKPKSKKTHLNLTNHRVIARTIFLNNDFILSLSENERRVVLEEAKKAAEFERNLSLEASKNHLDNIRHNRKDIVINEWSLTKRKNQRKIFSREYKHFDKRFGQGLIQKIIDLKGNPSREYASHP